MANGNIGLTLPEQQVPTSQSFDTRPAKVDVWIDTLPLSNIGETTRAILNALYETNRLQFPWQDRLSLLEKLSGTIQHIGSQLEQRFTTQPHPLPDQVRQVALLVKTLYQESALGYKIAMEQMLSGNALNVDRHALVTMLHRSLFHLGGVLLTCYQSYTNIPPGTWYDIHLIHQYARQQQLDQTVTSSPEAAPMAVMTIGGIYKQILLISLASPTRLNPGEVGLAYKALTNWSPKAVITPYSAGYHHDALFVIPVKSDHEPEYLAYAHHGCDETDCLLLDTRQMIEQMATEYVGITQTAETEGQTVSADGIPADLLLRLGRAWGMTSKRMIDRTDCSDTIQAVVGLKTLHQALQNEGTSPQGGSGSPDAGRHDVWALLSPGSSAEEVKHTHVDAARESVEVPIHEWQIQNESRGGYRLAISELWAEIQVGTLLGLRRPNTPWQVGVVRWLNDQDASHLSLGVQLLASDAYPVLIQAADMDDVYRPAIVLTSVTQPNHAVSLLAPANWLSPHSFIHLYSDGRSASLRIDKNSEQNSDFAQYLFHGGEGGSRKQDASGTTDKVPGFTNLWKQL